MKNKIIGISGGDPEGIGPEIIQKCLTNDFDSTIIVFGNPAHFDISCWHLINNLNEIKMDGVNFFPVEDSGDGGELSYHCVRIGVDMALAKEIDALVTAPISKEKWIRAGIPFMGHTEYLTKVSKVRDYAMLFWSDGLKVCLYSIHLPLRSIFDRFDKDSIICFFRFVSAELERLFRKKFTLLISGLNPHAGEDGVLGSEERDEIIPAIDEVKEDINIMGPFPPDIVFLKNLEISDSVVISWYHDQGLIPFKLLHLHSGVNVTLGLPFIRTSPDHGVAYDIVGKGVANPSSMMAAIRLAEDLIPDSS